jgi:hypothetical protein
MVRSMLLNLIIVGIGPFVELNTWIIIVYVITGLRLLADALEIIRGY